MDPTQAAALASIQTAIQQVAAMIVQITANPQPNYSVQGVSVSWSEYLATLTKQQIELQDALITLSGPYELRTIAVT